MIIATREQRRQLQRDNAKLPETLQPVPLESHPNPPSNLKAVWRSRHFLVQAFYEPFGVIRLSVNRSELGSNGRWLENITWEELQTLKRQAGYGEFYAIEVYPKDKDVVNVANMRHLWITEEPLNIGWVKS
jgi:hypothetical protein